MKTGKFFWPAGAGRLAVYAVFAALMGMSSVSGALDSSAGEALPEKSGIMRLEEEALEGMSLGFYRVRGGEAPLMTAKQACARFPFHYNEICEEKILNLVSPCHEPHFNDSHCWRKLSELSLSAESEFARQILYDMTAASPLPADWLKKIMACGDLPVKSGEACLDSLSHPAASERKIRACGLLDGQAEVLCLESLSSDLALEKIAACSGLPYRQQNFCMKAAAGDPEAFLELVCSIFERENQAACLKTVRAAGASRPSGLKKSLACGLLRSGNELPCLEFALKSDLESDQEPDGGEEAEQGPEISSSPLTAEKIKACSAADYYPFGGFLNERLGRPGPLLAKAPPSSEHLVFRLISEAYFGSGGGPGAQGAPAEKDARPSYSSAIKAAYETEESERLCLEGAAAGPALSFREIKACAAFDRQSEIPCLREAVARELSAGRTRACGRHADQMACLEAAQNVSSLPEQISACAVFDGEADCIQRAQSPPIDEAALAACAGAGLDPADENICRGILRRPALSAAEIRACRFFDGDSQKACLEAAKAQDLTSEEILACGLSGFADPGAKLVCLEKAAAPALSAEEIKLCGRHYEPGLPCLELAGAPALSLKEIRACGAADSGEEAACLEAALRPKLSLEEIKDCGRKIYFQGSEAECAAQAGKRFLLSSEEEEACEEHYEDPESCAEAAGIFNPGLKKIQACGAFYSGADEALCLKKAASPSLTADEIKGCGLGDFESQMLCLETAQELSLDMEGIRHCGAFYSENEIPCLMRISSLGLGASGASKGAAAMEAGQAIAACAALRGESEMACLNLALAGVSFESVRACGLMNFKREAERVCLEEAAAEGLSAAKIAACADFDSSRSGEGGAACLRAAGAAGLTARKIRACGAHKTADRGFCLKEARQPELDSSEILSCGAADIDRPRICLEEAADNPGLSAAKIKACGALPPDSERACLRAALSVEKTMACSRLFEEESLRAVCLEEAGPAALEKISACGAPEVESKKICLEEMPEPELTVEKISACGGLEGENEALCLKSARKLNLDSEISACLARPEAEQKDCFQAGDWWRKLLKKLPELPSF